MDKRESLSLTRKQLKQPSHPSSWHKTLEYHQVLLRSYSKSSSHPFPNVPLPYEAWIDLLFHAFCLFFSSSWFWFILVHIAWVRHDSWPSQADNNFRKKDRNSFFFVQPWNYHKQHTQRVVVFYISTWTLLLDLGNDHIIHSCNRNSINNFLFT